MQTPNANLVSYNESVVLPENGKLGNNFTVAAQ